MYTIGVFQISPHFADIAPDTAGLKVQSGQVPIENLKAIALHSAVGEGRGKKKKAPIL